MTSTTRGTNPQSGVEQVKEQVQDVAQQAKGQTRERLSSQIDERSTQAGDQLVSAAQALRRAAQQLRDEDNGRMADIVDSLVSRSERLGGYLRVADGDKILHDVESFGRRQPWLMAGGSAVLGFLASRFMKASSSGRYHRQGQQASGYPSRHLPDDASAGYVSPPGISAGTGGDAGGDARREGVGSAGVSGGVSGGLD